MNEKTKLRIAIIIIPKQSIKKRSENPSVLSTPNALPRTKLGAIARKPEINDIPKLRITSHGLRQRKLKYQCVADRYFSVGKELWILRGVEIVVWIDCTLEFFLFLVISVYVGKYIYRFPIYYSYYVVAGYKMRYTILQN